MKVTERINRYVVEITDEDANTPLPHHIWRDKNRPYVEMRYVDSPDSCMRLYHRSSNEPTLEITVDPTTFVPRMQPTFTWDIYIGDKVIETIQIPPFPYPDPVYEQD